MKIKFLLLIAWVGVAVFSSAAGQECGDCNLDGSINSSDHYALIMHLLYGDARQPGTPQMDLDDYWGITISDLVHYQASIESPSYADSFDCNSSFDYSFAPSPNDTVFIPRVLGIPSGVTSVVLPIRLSLQPDTRGAFIGIKTVELGGGFYEWRTTRTAWTDSNHIGAGRGAWNNDGKYRTFTVAPWEQNGSLAGNHHYFDITYLRYNGGITNIRLDTFDIDHFHRVSVVKGHDLFIPTVVVYDYTLPPDTLKISASTLAFHAPAGEKCPDTLSVRFTSGSSPITFQLAANQPWVTLLGASGNLTTPDTVRIVVDAGRLPEGLYVDSIVVVNPTSALGAIAPQTSLSVQFTVGQPYYFPPGDVNCDGLLDLRDLSTVIARLMGAIPAIQPCY